MVLEDKPFNLKPEPKHCLAQKKNNVGTWKDIL